eukprot:TRINITY_DN13328_c0_g1_i1.p1 TRINITY_DN13328_c0_g1~~TRINITY_DN13328_c0_g1_i1.p1  ORF type:complete len:108 (-),score=9.88 TRINITY_DN13328_c0_g1_i1:22-345(-)
MEQVRSVGPQLDRRSFPQFQDSAQWFKKSYGHLMQKGVHVSPAGECQRDMSANASPAGECQRDMSANASPAGECQRDMSVNVSPAGECQSSSLGTRGRRSTGISFQR